MIKHKVVLLTKDSLYSRDFFAGLLPDAEIEVVGIVQSDTMLHRGTDIWADLRAFVKLVGLRYALYQCYVSILLPLWLLRRFSPARLASQYQVPLLKTKDINNAAAHKWLQQRQADFFVCFHFNQRLHPTVLTTARHAVVNFHPSLLPDYRGVDPVFFSLREGETRFGGTIHLINAALDEGEILMQHPLATTNKAHSKPTLIALNRQLFRQGGQMMAQILSQFQSVFEHRIPQGKPHRGYRGWRHIQRANKK